MAEFSNSSFSAYINDVSQKREYAMFRQTGVLN